MKWNDRVACKLIMVVARFLMSDDWADELREEIKAIQTSISVDSRFGD